MARLEMLLPVAIVALVAGPLSAQESASYKLDEHVFNAGGHPDGGTVLASASYQITLGSIGEPLSARVAGGSYSVDGGFDASYPPPGEVTGLRFQDAQTLFWQPEPSLGGYNLYRGPIAGVGGTGYGDCAQSGLVAPLATDGDPVGPGAGFFYLVTALNLLDEEGVKGLQSNGTPRLGEVCP